MRCWKTLDVLGSADDSRGDHVRVRSGSHTGARTARPGVCALEWELATK